MPFTSFLNKASDGSDHVAIEVAAAAAATAATDLSHPLKVMFYYLAAASDLLMLNRN